MIDFKKRLSNSNISAPTNPIEIYDKLDRSAKKGPLRPAQRAVLEEWYLKRKKEESLIVKLHTGQGKTLIGLLMLQSQLNQSKGPSIYICPNNFLIKQTCEQAKQFGISVCTCDGGIPPEFTSSKKILVTSVQKLFNGKSQFGINNKSIHVESVVMDDAHACADSIRDAFKIKIPKDVSAYSEILSLFSTEVEQQGAGRYADIINGKHDVFIPVPYWAWASKESEVASILSKHSDKICIKFTWPLVKDMLDKCQCVISGTCLEIEPYISPIEKFGSYWNAKCKIFMSATVTDDAYLVKGLQLPVSTIIKPICYDQETWSGEKMVLIPSLISSQLDRTEVMNLFSKPNPKNNYGIVALASSFENTKDWEKNGAIISRTETIEDDVQSLQAGNYDKTLVLVNRYDGVDLPDNSCRVLIVDRNPHAENLIDLYNEECRPFSDATLMRTLRKIEQGTGRSVRGQKDYSVIIMTGDDISLLMRDRLSKKHISAQMSKQIDIGLEIASLAQDDIENKSVPPIDALCGLIDQCTSRDDGWKAFYVEQMDSIVPVAPNIDLLNRYKDELDAEQYYLNGDIDKAVGKLQSLCDKVRSSRQEMAWYLQEIARMYYGANIIESQNHQLRAYNNNRLLLKPKTGVVFEKLTTVSHKRMERVIAWIRQFENYQQLDLTVNEILSRLTFGTKADSFEKALDQICNAIGLETERPDKLWKEGPDALSAIDDVYYVTWECKSEVDLARAEIDKREAEQLNRHCAWFDKHYPGCKSKTIIIHPARAVQSAAAFTHEVFVMRDKHLKLFCKNIKLFFKSISSDDFNSLSPLRIQKLLDAHNLSKEKIINDYCTTPKNMV